MLIYKNKDNNIISNSVNTYLTHQRCIQLTFEQYKDKEYINDNMCSVEVETQGANIKNTIISNLNDIRRKIIPPFKPRGNTLVPLPIYVIIAKKLESDPAYNIVTKLIEEVEDDVLKTEIDKISGELDSTSLKKFIFKGNYKVVIYVPNLMNLNKKYCYFPSLDAFSKQNRWMELLVSKFSFYLTVIKNDIDYTSDLIRKSGGENKYYSQSKTKLSNNEKKMKKKNEENYKDDYLYNNLNTTCYDMGCYSEAGEDLKEMIPQYTTDNTQMDNNIKTKSPYYPSKCFQMPDYKKWMIDDSGEDEESKKKIAEFQKKVIDEISDYDGPTDDIAGLIKTAIADTRKEVYPKAGKKSHEYGKVYNNSILKDLSKRYNKYPGIPEITFPIYQLNENDQDFVSLVHHMPWNNILLKQDYVMNDGESIEIDNLSFKSFDNSCLIRFDNEGFLSIYTKIGTIYKKKSIVEGAENINMKKYTERILKYEFGIINIYGKENNGSSDNKGSIILNINSFKPPLSIILTNDGKIITYDMGVNKVST